MKQSVNKLITLLITVIFFTPITNAQKINNNILIKNKTINAPIFKKKKPTYCKAIENAVRNIRSIKQLSQELDKYSNKVLFDCLKTLISDRTLTFKLNQLKDYLNSRKKKQLRQQLN